MAHALVTADGADLDDCTAHTACVVGRQQAHTHTLCVCVCCACRLGRWSTCNTSRPFSSRQWWAASPRRASSPSTRTRSLQTLEFRALTVASSPSTRTRSPARCPCCRAATKHALICQAAEAPRNSPFQAASSPHNRPCPLLRHPARARLPVTARPGRSLTRAVLDVARQPSWSKTVLTARVPGPAGGGRGKGAKLAAGPTPAANHRPVPPGYSQAWRARSRCGLCNARRRRWRAAGGGRGAMGRVSCGEWGVDKAQSRRRVDCEAASLGGDGAACGPECSADAVQNSD